MNAGPRDAASGRLEFRILGPLEALRDGAPISLGPRRQRALLALLILNTNRLVSADQLIEELWAGRPPPSGLKTLRSYLSRLRAELAPDSVLESRSGGYVLSLGPDQLDSFRFERLLGEGQEAVTRGAVAEAAERLREGLALWRGRALADLADEPFARVEALRLDELHLAAREERIQADLELGRHGELVSELEALVAEQPLRERLWGQLMTALYRSARQAEALAAYRRARGLLADQLGLEPGVELRTLEQQILRQELRAAPTPVPPNNVPARLTSFVGRQRELEELGLLLGEGRLVTVTGVGGCGKTRLALELADTLIPRFHDGVFFIELAGLGNAELVPHAVASALKVTERSHRRVVEALAERLRPRSLLLVLDNCEHLLEASAELVERLLSGCPQLRILTTSRESLAVPGEVVYQLPPLPVPEEAAEEPAHYPAVRLFLERAAAARPGLERIPALATVARICRELDGLPLALELAAARTRVLTVEEVADRLDDRFRFLRYWRRSPEPRHQTLGATMDWSYDLLSTDEQAALRGLSVFAGGCTLSAVAAVCLEGDEEAALTLLTRLVDASLVIAEPLDGTMRFRVLETVRRYAGERLADAGETERTRRRHAEYFVDVAEHAWLAIDTVAEGSWLSVLEVERDNLRTALEWSLDAESDLGVRLARALGYFWRIHGHLDEGRRFLERALLRVGERNGLRGELLGWLGHILVRQNQFARATEVLQEAVERTAEAGARLSQGRFLHFLAFAWRVQGEFGRAASLLEEALVVRREIGDAAGLAWSTGSLADMAWLQGRAEEAARLYERGWALVREAGAPPALAVAYTHSRADLALFQGNVELGERLAEEGLRIARELGDTWHVGLALNTMARAAREQGELEHASVLLLEAMRTLWELREMSSVAETLEILAGVAAERGNTTTATKLQAVAATIRATHGAPVPPAHKARLERDLATLRSRLGEAAFEEAWEAGAQTTPERAIANALGDEPRLHAS